MISKDFPIIGVGPGTQPEEEDGARLEYIELPREMDAYRRPVLPELDEVEGMGAAMAAMDWLQDTLDNYVPDGRPRVAELSALDPDNRDVVNQILGEGEVSVRYEGAFQARMQESILAGVWRTFYVAADGTPVRDLIEVGEMPHLTRLEGRSEGQRSLRVSDTEVPPDVMNALPILTEIGESLEDYRGGQPAHVVNLSLLPVSPDDTEFLDRLFGTGPVQILSRGYGDCRITSTQVPHLWWVRYHNSTGKLILNSLEVVDMPVAARAAEEDVESSARRLRELMEPYR